MLSVIDSAKATPNLWGERWSKLVINSMGNGVSAITGMSSKDCAGHEGARRLTIQLAGEAISVGRAHGFDLEEIQGVVPEKWIAASCGGTDAIRELEEGIAARIARMTDEGRPSTAQDIEKGRRTEIDFLNGLVAEKGAEAGVPAPTHAALVSVVHDIERGELEPAPRLIDEVWRLATNR
jgi:2-dehydropantoate 2-reductase